MSLTLASFTLAEGEKELETAYPTVPEAQTPTKITTPLPEYVRYLFNFSIWIAGFVAFATLIYGGVRYITSAGSPSATADARGQIFAGILGLIIIISAYAVLVNINPQLVILRVDYEGAPAAGEVLGVYLCKNASLDTENCVVYTMSSDTIDPKFDNHVQYIYFKKAETITYGAVLHEDKGRRGECGIYTTDGPVSGKPSSITIFKQGNGGGKAGTVYKHKQYNELTNEKEYYDLVTNEYKDLNNYKFTNCKESLTNDCTIDDKISSLKVSDGFMIVLFEGSDFTDRCQVFTQDDEYLKIGGYVRNDAVSSIIVKPIQ